MPTETQIQSDIIKSFNMSGDGIGYKMGSQFQAGRPDLLLKTYPMEAWLLEVKKVHRPRFTKPMQYLHPATALQIEEQKKLDAAGFLCGFLLIEEKGGGEYRFAVRHYNTLTLSVREWDICSTVKPRGMQWKPILEENLMQMGERV